MATFDGPKTVQAVELAKMMRPRRPKSFVNERGDFVFTTSSPGITDNRFTPDEFSIGRVAAPSRQTELERLRRVLAGTGWEREVGSARGKSGG